MLIILFLFVYKDIIDAGYIATFVVGVNSVGYRDWAGCAGAGPLVFNVVVNIECMLPNIIRAI